MPDSQQSHRRRPLPDAQAIRPFCVPEAAPPYDDEIPARPRPGRHRNLAHGNGRESGGQAVAVPGTWPSRFAQVLSEALAGSRPASQLTPWTTEQARKRIGQLGPLLATRAAPAHRAGPAPQPRVRRVIVSSPVQGVLEMTVIVDVGSRARAVAVRLERPSSADAGPPARYLRGRQPLPAGAWLCTAIEGA
ncbi:MAG TPA: Rv3235 family protein [Streptosporangiaceae bacterium]|nr:Rv3235 family protein [Streptosporangiaceae bacterium]